MAVTVIEAMQSQSVSTSSGESTGARTFHVWDDASPLTEPGSVAALFGTNGLPIYGDSFPGITDVNLIASDQSIKRLDGHIDTWRVDWVYKEAPLSPLQQKDPLDVGYVEVSGDVRGEFVDVWRAMPASAIASLTSSGGPYPSGSPTVPFQTDIGGSPIDVAGEPVSALVRQAEVEFGVTMDSVPNVGFFGAFVGRRNSVSFNGAAVGKVLFVGAAVRRIGPWKWSIGLRFIADEHFHMRQAPKVNPDGTVQTGTYVNNGIHANKVYFVQPYPDFANFYALSPYLTGVV